MADFFFFKERRSLPEICEKALRFPGNQGMQKQTFHLELLFFTLFTLVTLLVCVCVCRKEDEIFCILTSQLLQQEVKGLEGDMRVLDPWTYCASRSRLLGGGAGARAGGRGGGA